MGSSFSRFDDFDYEPIKLSTRLNDTSAQSALGGLVNHNLIINYGETMPDFIQEEAWSSHQNSKQF